MDAGRGKKEDTTVGTAAASTSSSCTPQSIDAGQICPHPATRTHVTLFVTLLTCFVVCHVRRVSSVMCDVCPV